MFLKRLIGRSERSKPGFADQYWVGAPEEIRTPVPQIRSAIYQTTIVERRRPHFTLDESGNAARDCLFRRPGR
jgi:hypothetical protein